MSIELLISDLESHIEYKALIDANIEFDARMIAQDETVTLSEALSNHVSAPLQNRMIRLVDNYLKLQGEAPNHQGMAGFTSWTCCDYHKRLSYAYLLLKAIAHAYPLDSEGQALSELWIDELKKGDKNAK